MKLLVDAHVLDDLSQGSKTYLNGLYASILRLNKKDDFYFATHHAASLGNELKSQPNAHQLLYSSHNKFARLAWDIPKLVSSNEIKWAHFQYISPVIKTCSEIVTIHDLLFLDYPDYFPLDYRLIKNFLIKRSAKRADWVLTVSEYSKQSLIKHYHLDPRKIVITPNGILDFFWDPLETKSTIREKYGIDKFILNVSRFEPRKNQSGLLRSYLKLELWKQGIQLVFVGGVGIRTPEFQMLLQSLDSEVRKMIFCMEDLPLADLKWLYKNSLLFVYPSFAEGFGIPPLEALACGASVICSNATAMSEYHFLGDRLFNPLRQEEMTEKINHFTNNPHVANLGMMQDYIRKNYSWDTSAERFLGIVK